MNTCNRLVPFTSAMKRAASGTAVAFMIGATLSAPALAQDKYPSRPLVVILPFAPGSSADIAANMIKSKMQPAFGQPIVIEHKPGANQILAYQTTARATSSGVEAFPSGAVASQCCFTAWYFSSPSASCSQRPWIMPGHTAFTRTSGASTRASDSVIVLSADLEAA